MLLAWLVMELQKDETLRLSTRDRAALRTADAVPAPVLGPGLLLADRYLICGLLGHGGMAEVYLARDRLLELAVALKVIRAGVAADAGARARFRREALLARRVSHRNVCRAFDFDIGRDAAGRELPFITMELLAGETLARRLRRTGAMTTAQARPIARQIAHGLAAAHAAGVVHRDLKLGNVILVDDPAGARAVLTDFGVARCLRAARPTTISLDARVLGTPAYMAPEQIVGDVATPRTDIYALGMLLFELVTGRRPFGSTETSLGDRLMGPPPSPREHVPTVNARWDAVIRRCLQPRPEERYATAIEVARAL